MGIITDSSTVSHRVVSYEPFIVEFFCGDLARTESYKEPLSTAELREKAKHITFTKAGIPKEYKLKRKRKTFKDIFVMIFDVF